MNGWLRLWRAVMGRDGAEFPHIDPIVEERYLVRGVEVVTHTNFRHLQAVLTAKEISRETQ
jgi:hypothetical protein